MTSFLIFWYFLFNPIELDYTAAAEAALSS